MMLHFTSTFFLALPLILASLGLWWLIRRRQTRSRLPIMRIMEKKFAQKPQLALSSPPLLPFLCFLLLAVSLCLLLLKPAFVNKKPLAPQKSRVHILLDMSPSLSAQLNFASFREKVSALWLDLASSRKLTFSTSHSPEIWSVESQESLHTKLSQFGFHRSGFLLGSGLKKQWEAIEQADDLIIVADKDAHSWQNFNWQYLQNETNVWRIDFSHSWLAPENIYISKAHEVSQASSQVHEWDLSLARQGRLATSSGKLNVTYEGKTLATQTWQFADGQSELTLRLSWPKNLILTTPTSPQNLRVLLWEIKPSVVDALVLDNTFRTGLSRSEFPAILIAETHGEQKLENPIFSLQTAFEVLGIRLQRFEWLPLAGPKVEDFALWLLFSYPREGIDRSCPSRLSDFRLSLKPKPEPSESKPQIWLIPYDTRRQSLQNLCWCYHRLLLAKTSDSPKPEFCQDVQDRESLGIVLQALGAQQLGGQAGQSSAALAWQGKDKKTSLSLLAFSLPLFPIAGGGINHGTLPLLLKELGESQGILPAKGQGIKGREWPRVSDLSQEVAWLRPQADGTASQLLLQASNIPLGESLLHQADANSLPPIWQYHSQSRQFDEQRPLSSAEALPWILILSFMVLLLTLAEGLASLVFRHHRQKQQESPSPSPRKKGLTFFLLGLLASLSISGKAQAYIHVSVFAYPSGKLTLERLAQEVSRRTSLRFSKEVRSSSKLAESLTAQPWLWVTNLQSISQSDQSMLALLQDWIKRGGFLILEGPHSLESLEALTAQGFNLQRSPARWTIIPPDHELMRSFYLLDALPACGLGNWYGFHFDNRLAILSIPYAFLDSLSDGANPPQACPYPPSLEQAYRIFINTLMVTLTTDYKKDQIHMREILKRLPPSTSFP